MFLECMQKPSKIFTNDFDFVKLQAEVETFMMKCFYKND